MAHFSPKLPTRVGFEERDLGIFSIPDPRTRLDTIQHYFFPRMEALLLQTCDLIADIYGVNVFEKMTINRRPNHRSAKRSKNVVDSGEVYVGLTPKRKVFKRRIYRDSGKAYEIGPSFLVFNLDLEGGLQVCLWPYVWSDLQFIEDTYRMISKDMVVLSHLLNRFRIFYPSLRKRQAEWSGPLWHFPLTSEKWLKRLQLDFAVLYPVFQAISNLAIGQPTNLMTNINRFSLWHHKQKYSRGYLRNNKDDMEKIDLIEDIDEILGEVGTYKTLRPGIWYEILQRDEWKCRSCGRTVSDGVLLEIDHIFPRSLGGTNDPENLQTLCKKCNIGKSNKDSTDLRK